MHPRLIATVTKEGNGLTLPCSLECWLEPDGSVSIRRVDLYGRMDLGRSSSCEQIEEALQRHPIDPASSAVPLPVVELALVLLRELLDRMPTGFGND